MFKIRKRIWPGINQSMQAHVQQNRCEDCRA